MAAGSAKADGTGAASSAADAKAGSARREARSLTSTSGKTLKVICTSESYKELFAKFTDEVGAPVEFISMSSGEALSKLKAEGGTPDADLWFGGGIDSFMSAKESGLLEQVNFDAAADFAEGFKDPDNYWFSKGVTVVGFIVNHEILDEIGAEVPGAWTDLTDESYRGEILMSSPAISGTNYAAVAALLQSMGEDAGWDYFTKLNENIPFYTKRGSDPSTRVSTGEAAVGITYIDNTLDDILADGTLELVYPSDGMPYIPDGVAVFKNADDADDAKLFIEWLFSSDENMRALAAIDKKSTMLLCIPTIQGLTLDFDKSQLLDEDLSQFGTKREETLAKWEEITSGKETISE
ncbi:ABC transporter substrate-binding protein [bacterium]|nr:ABC transporter substrate-binding protein [bacterium]